MLTEEQVKEMTEQFEVLKNKKAAKLKECATLQEEVKTSIEEWLKTISCIDNLKIDFRYDYDYTLDAKKYDYRGHLCIDEIEGKRSCAFGYFEVNIRPDALEYSHSSGSFSSTDVNMIMSVKLMSAILSNEEKLKELVFEKIDEYETLVDEYYEECFNFNEVERQLNKHNEEVKREEASKKLMVDTIYSDGAGDGWYLKVLKITNKQVKCMTYKYYDFYDIKKGLYSMHERTINKDDFLRRLCTDYYKITTDKEIVE